MSDCALVFQSCIWKNSKICSKHMVGIVLKDCSRIQNGYFLSYSWSHFYSRTWNIFAYITYPGIKILNLKFPIFLSWKITWKYRDASNLTFWTDDFTRHNSQGCHRKAICFKSKCNLWTRPRTKTRPRRVNLWTAEIIDSNIFRNFEVANFANRSWGGKSRISPIGREINRKLSIGCRKNSLISPIRHGKIAHFVNRARKNS